MYERRIPRTLRIHRSGAGTTLIEHVEDLLQGFGEAVARTLIVDTSSLDAYEQARAFYDRPASSKKTYPRLLRTR